MTPARRQRLEVLPGGLLVAGEEIPGSELTALHLRLALGAIDDPDGKRGLAHLTQELLWRGTATKDSILAAKRCSRFLISSRSHARRSNRFLCGTRR